MKTAIQEELMKEKASSLKLHESISISKPEKRLVHESFHDDLEIFKVKHLNHLVMSFDILLHSTVSKPVMNFSTIS